MVKLNDIKGPVEKELKEFDHFFESAMRSEVPLLGLIIKYILRRKGKMMRPLLVFLTAALNGKINKATYIAAAMIELLHTATLVHDDVVDASNMRRGFFSINALWKSKIAVLMGDFLLSKGLLIALKNKEHDLLSIMSEAVSEMIEGELLQIQKARKLDINEELYFEIIRKKTATLISSCTACAAQSVKASEDIIFKMKEFGENLGIAFQIRDDLLDFDLKNKSGKPSGNDLQEKKLTLPLIHALHQSNRSEKRRILTIINKKLNKKDSVAIIHEFVEKYEGIDYAKKVMNEYKSKASDILNTYEDSEYKTSLLNLVDFVVERKI